MKRIVNLLACFAALAAAYAAALSRPGLLQGRERLMVALLPAIILLCFALYALATLLLGVAAFRDVPEANAGLQSDIAEARKDLARRGVVDVVASD